MITHKKGEQWIVKIPFMFCIHAELCSDCREIDDSCFLKINVKKFKKIMNENKKQFDKYMKKLLKQSIIAHNSDVVIFQKQVKV